MPKAYYITTPIYYVNSVPHIGTALTTLASDVTARYQRLRGREVTFLTGTDENGLKILEAAEQAGKTPQAFVDEISQEFRRIWQGLDIRYDTFIRTTEPRHFEAAQEVFRRLQAAWHITAGKYEGWYDVSTETFYRESELVDGKSPDGNEVRWIEEDNYFFRLSQFEKPLLEHLEKHPDFIVPHSRRNEVIGFIKQGLRDVCVSRTNQGWGVPVPGDESKVIYVWFEALINYISAIDWPNGDWQSRWPAEVEWMGKDILTRFHATLWPAMLMGLGLPLPETLVGHGWMLMGGEKISKSKGNVVAPLDLASDLVRRVGCEPQIAVDAVRAYMASTMPYEQDAVFTYEAFAGRYNADLANDLGNALNRSLAMTHKFAEGRVPEGAIEPEAVEAIRKAKADFEDAMARFRLDEATEAAWAPARFLNKYIDARAPWALAKAGDPALGGVLRSMLLCLRALEGLMRPIAPSAADAFAAQLGVAPTTSWEMIGAESSLPVGTELAPPTPIFPRIDFAQGAFAPEAPTGSSEPPSQGGSSPMQTPSQEIEASPAASPTISIDDFTKVKLCVGRVLEAEAVEGSDKLLKLQVVVGEERRQIVAGIRAQYQPLDLVGRQVVVVMNLKPAKLRGVESQGMLLAATDAEGGAILLQPDKEAPEGAGVR